MLKEFSNRRLNNNLSRHGWYPLYKQILAAIDPFVTREELRAAKKRYIATAKAEPDATKSNLLMIVYMTKPEDLPYATPREATANVLARQQLEVMVLKRMPAFPKVLRAYCSAFPQGFSDEEILGSWRDLEISELPWTERSSGRIARWLKGELKIENLAHSGKPPSKPRTTRRRKKRRK